MNDFGGFQHIHSEGRPQDAAAIASSTPAPPNSSSDALALAMLVHDLERAEALLSVLTESRSLIAGQFAALAEMAHGLVNTAVFAAIELGDVLLNHAAVVKNLGRAEAVSRTLVTLDGVDEAAAKNLAEMAWGLVQECYFILTGRPSEEADLPSYFVPAKEKLS